LIREALLEALAEAIVPADMKKFQKHLACIKCSDMNKAS